MGALLDIFLRTGFSSEVRASSGSVDDLDRQASRVEYSIDTSFGEVLQQIGAGSAPYVALVDAATVPAKHANAFLHRMLACNRTIPGLTLMTDTLETLYGWQPSETRVDAVRQSLLPIDRAPSWFTILNRELLSKEILNSPYETLEFFLLDLERRLRDSGLSLFCCEQPLLLESSSWIKDLLAKSAPRLALDYESFRAKHTGANDLDAVPSQFRVEILGEFDAEPLLLKAVAQPPVASEAPQFTVICAAYKPDFFAEALKSVLDQTHGDWELLVMVDGPPEPDQQRLIDILDQHADEPRLHYEVQGNRGTGPSRNRLSRKARGTFVLSLDDDDMLAPVTLASFAAAILRYPDVDFFRGGAQMIGVINRYHPPRARVLVDGISADFFEVTQPFLLRRSSLMALGSFQGDDAIKGAGDDTDLFLRIDREKFRTIIIDQPLYYRRLSSRNQSLSFVLPDALGHMETIDRRFTPPNWMLIDRIDEQDGLYTSSIQTYANLLTGLEVHCPTRYFSYQTLGDTSDRPIDLEITSVCNAVCPFCPREVLANKNKHMPFEIVERLADHLRKENDGRKVLLCGIGESTLHPHLEKIVSLLTDAGARIGMTTNGTLLNGERFDRLVACGLQEVNFSLNAVTGSVHQKVMKLKNFEQVSTNLDEILVHHLDRYPHVDVHVSFVLCNLNEAEALPFIERWRETNVSKVWIHPVNNRAGLLSEEVEPVDIEYVEDRYRDDPKVVVDIFRSTPEDGAHCKIADQIDFISSDGSMRLCAMDYQRTTFFGNLDLHGVQDMHLTKMLSYIRGDTAELCRDCDFCPERQPVAAAEASAAGVSVASP